ncbi:hypothetical protein RCO48_26105 [Peribacillus frigoritolerans]|nr:hypothetical protein [Peribacillus frigoritolerans]
MPIKKIESQEAASKEQEQEQTDESFEWILPEDSNESKIVLVPSPPKKKMPKLIGFGTGSLKSSDKRPDQDIHDRSNLCCIFWVDSWLDRR